MNYSIKMKSSNLVFVNEIHQLFLQKLVEKVHGRLTGSFDCVDFILIFWCHNIGNGCTNINLKKGLYSLEHLKELPYAG
jgi:hypothetical protein